MTGHPTILHQLLVAIGVEAIPALILLGAWTARWKPTTMKGDTP